jgi:hypothetical protein
MKYEINLTGFQRFDEGTNVKHLGKPKFIILTDQLYSQATRLLECSDDASAY